MIGIKYNDKQFQVEPGLRVKEIIKQAEGGDSPNLLAVRVNGKLSDLNSIVDSDAQLEPVTFSESDGKSIYWHSSSHLMAAAVKKLWPDVRVAIGPSIDEGFYYDFDSEALSLKANWPRSRPR